MAVQHHPIGTNTRLGGELLACLNTLEDSLDKLHELVGSMVFMVDGGDVSHLEEQFGLQTGDGTAAKAELESMVAAYDGAAGVVAAFQQAFNKFR